jgi:hypothetical protein
VDRDPHVPHSWEAGLPFDETTRTLLCSDLFSHLGEPETLNGEAVVERALESEQAVRFTSLTPSTAPTMRRLADLAPETVATMHGGTLWGDGRAAMLALAQGDEALFNAAIQTPRG